MSQPQFLYADERFADIQMLRYRLNGFEDLTIRQKQLIYYLSQATLSGRDITFDQYGKYNLLIRKTLEAIYVNKKDKDHSEQFTFLSTYLKRLWFSNGIHHHYGCMKFIPGFSPDYLFVSMEETDSQLLPLRKGQTVRQLFEEIKPVIFDPTIFAKRVNKEKGVDLITSSACNFYQDVTQDEVETYYKENKDDGMSGQPSWGLNSTLVKEDGEIREIVWKADGKYGNAIQKIIIWLEKAEDVAENDNQKDVIKKLIRFYKSGDLHDFDDYSIAWVHDKESQVDFINGFIEVYGDPLGLKGTWEGIVEYVDKQASLRTKIISDNAQWFEDHSPVDPRFKKKQVKGVSASVICAAMLGGEEYPASAIGINLPNAEWIRERHGSKSVTIGNLTEAYNQATKGSGFREEFVIDEQTVRMLDQYDNLCDDLHTDLHECLGHGSGQLLPGTSPDALKAYSSTIEEARADLFALYYMADEKLVELNLLPDHTAYQAQYYSYMLNGLMTQLTRITPGHDIEEAHMRNRALIAYWTMRHSKGNVQFEKIDGKTFVRIHDYKKLRDCFAELLGEIQRIKSEGDYHAAQQLIETYAVKVDGVLHEEVLQRFSKLNIAPYKGFINPVLKPITDASGNIIDVTVEYTEKYDEQMLRYSKQYGTL
ncbi:MAG: dihydrofolate reductase [Prevotella sp.]|nr:dihydrofolate reductase [Prevotella sp.]